MEVTGAFRGREAEVRALFEESFTAAEGAAEGQMIGRLVETLLERTPGGDLRLFLALEDGAALGGAIFTRLDFAGSPESDVRLLSPMAVASTRRGEGIGQSLLRHALHALAREGVDVAMTYGDPTFYGKVGFVPLDVAHVPAPYPLSQPIGWIGQSLSGGAVPPLSGPVRCAAALDDPALW